ncbi:hypothetical protein BED42_03280 [Citrobacter portucalensis]|nr:hypothetical protein BED42_03280 [Citrobacter portucalensis]
MRIGLWWKSRRPLTIFTLLHGHAASGQWPVARQPKIWRLFRQAKSFAIVTNKLIFFYQKVNGISESDTGIYMFLYNSFITEWRVVQ